MSHAETASPSPAPAARWQPLPARERRVLGVLVEKAKTTPDGYPMTVNSICTGCNQKSNRAPMTQYEPEEVQESLDKLRQLGAVTEVFGSGRVSKYRHHFYEWLGVDKIEAAIMAELLLRGAQTVGELRARAARMGQIDDMAALTTLLAALEARGLVLALTPPGRGRVVTHGLYEPRELERLRTQYGPGFIAATEPSPDDSDAPPARAVHSSPVPTGSSSAATSNSSAVREEIAELRSEVAELRAKVEKLASTIESLLA